MVYLDGVQLPHWIKRVVSLVNIPILRSYHSNAVFGYEKETRKEYAAPKEKIDARNSNCKFNRLVWWFRQNGYKNAVTNPLFPPDVQRYNESTALINVNEFGLRPGQRVQFEHIIYATKMIGTVQEAVDLLSSIYQDKTSYEFVHMRSEEEIEWFCQMIETRSTLSVDPQTRIDTAIDLLKSQALDRFLAIKFPGVKRYGGEGAESMLIFFRHLMKLLSGLDIVIAMPHRGRLNLLTGIFEVDPIQIFAKLKGLDEFPTMYEVSGDVLSHLDFCGEINNSHVTLLHNPSHLEVINPVSMGKTRARQMLLKDGFYGTSRWSEKCLNVQVHGDAAILGQGVNQECLAFSSAPHFEIGGTIHLVVNNQLGFTTPTDRSRSSTYCTDLAKIIGAPIIHVNGDAPEDVWKATELAFKYQRRFRKDVFIDLCCYRQWGHNELDDPTLTNPVMYKIIKSKKTVPDIYSSTLVNRGILREGEPAEITNSYNQWLNERLKAVDSYVPENRYFQDQWLSLRQARPEVSTWDTGVSSDMLSFIGCASVRYPDSFNIHLNLQKHHVKNRLSKISEGMNIDWSTAEALAIGTLIYEGHHVRISGQDVGRGTFSHRHVTFVDQETNEVFIPLNNIHAEQTHYLEVANSILSEEAVLGYEYGMSIGQPKSLIIWEAQFGDFFNGAQVIFDTFIANAEAKWLWCSGLVILLPHGYDGAGPEHSSARIERFLQLTDSKETSPDGDNVNIQVCHPSTPAQYFHLLRRQIIRDFRKPLIVIAPKTLLRAPEAVSAFSEMTAGTYFKPVMAEPVGASSSIKRILFTSGRHYYTLMEQRKQLGLQQEVAIVRLESLCPFPLVELMDCIKNYPKNVDCFWCQEEPRNMGAWTFVKPRFENLLAKKLHYCGRPTLAAPAVGFATQHLAQVTHLTHECFRDMR